MTEKMKVKIRLFTIINFRES